MEMSPRLINRPTLTFALSGLSGKVPSINQVLFDSTPKRRKSVWEFVSAPKINMNSVNECHSECERELLSYFRDLMRESSHGVKSERRLRGCRKRRLLRSIRQIRIITCNNFGLADFSSYMARLRFDDIFREPVTYVITA